jgi:group I intron endonuclease
MIIYKTTNLINGKIYIGQDSKNRPQYLGSGVYLKKAIKKYGKNNFIKEILEDSISTKDILNLREIYWIKKFNSIDSNIGYNLTKGGNGSLGIKVSEEKRKKISESLKGKPKSKLHKQRLSESQRGKILSESHRQALSESHKGNIPWNVGQRYKHKNPIASISEERKLQISLTLKNKTKIQCPHCGLVGSPSAIKHWHFDKCKLLKNEKN